MERTLTLSPDPIRETDLIASAVPSTRLGAVIRFSGVVRGEEDGAPIAGIDYEAFVPMVDRQFGPL